MINIPGIWDHSDGISKSLNGALYWVYQHVETSGTWAVIGASRTNCSDAGTKIEWSRVRR